MMRKEEVEYKVGDKVRCIKNDYSLGPKPDEVFEIKKITEVLGELRYFRNPRHAYEYCTADEIELVGEVRDEISARCMVEITIEEDTFLISYEQACELHRALEKAGV